MFGERSRLETTHYLHRRQRVYPNLYCKLFLFVEYVVSYMNDNAIFYDVT